MRVQTQTCAETPCGTLGDAASASSTGPDCWLILAGQSPRPSVQSAPHSWQSIKHTPERRGRVRMQADSCWPILDAHKIFILNVTISLHLVTEAGLEHYFSELGVLLEL